MTSRTVNVPSISCGHCVATIEREAEQVSKNVTITWDPEATDWVVIEGLMKEINHPPSG